MGLNIPNQNYFSFELLNSSLLIESIVISSSLNPDLKSVWLEPHTFGITRKSNLELLATSRRMFQVTKKTRLFSMQQWKCRLASPGLGPSQEKGPGQTPCPWVNAYVCTRVHARTHTHTPPTRRRVLWDGAKAIFPFHHWEDPTEQFYYHDLKMGSQRLHGKQPNFVNNY